MKYDSEILPLQVLTQTLETLWPSLDIIVHSVTMVIQPERLTPAASSAH